MPTLFYVTMMALFLSMASVNAQNPTIQAIEFEGLKKTEKDYLQRFIKTSIGETLDSIQLEADACQLRNLNAFSDVQYKVKEKTKDKRIITFICKEVKTLLPIFNFGIVPQNEWVKVGAMDVNSFGKGIELSGFYQYNRRHSFLFQARVPNIKGSAWGISGNILKWSSQEPLYFDEQTVQYNYDNNSLQLGIIYDLTLNQRLEVAGSIFQEKYEKRNAEEIQLPGPNQVSLLKGLGRLQYSLRQMDYFFFYRSGYINDISYQVVGTEGLPDLFHIVTNDFRWYKRISPKVNIAVRNVIGISTNNNSPFAAYVVDSHVNLRGSGNRIARATGMTSLNIEGRYSIWETDTLAVQGVGFVDAGFWRTTGRAWITEGAMDNILVFGGGGLRFIHKRIYNAVFRIDFGVNLEDIRHHGIVIGLGQYF